MNGMRLIFALISPTRRPLRASHGVHLVVATRYSVDIEKWPMR
jgi:hypothetical protein